MIITIDGPAGAGKSSAARVLARRLGYDFLDTGAMYRAVTLAVLRTETDLACAGELAQLLAGLRLEMPPGRVVLNGEDVTAEIRAPAISAHASPLSSNPAIRQFLVGLQRAFAAGRAVVSEGRDQGTVVFPDAACKFFLDAAPEERARRRQRELLARGETVTLEEVLQAQQERDRRDASRELAPMVPAADAIRLDSTGLTLDQVVARMEHEVRCRTGSPPSSTKPLPGFA